VSLLARVETLGERCVAGVPAFQKRLHGFLGEFLTQFPPVLDMSAMPLDDASAIVALRERGAGPAPTDPATGFIAWGTVARSLRVDDSVPEVARVRAGERAAATALGQFLESPLRVDRYDVHRNSADRPEVRSQLSPYIRFGQLSAQRCCLELLRVYGGEIRGLFVSKPADGFQHWAKELLVRRELAENYCYHQRSVSAPVNMPRPPLTTMLLAV
jgi:deoxyribodipyrimidine photolyase